MASSLVGHIISMEARKIMSYRTDFWIHNTISICVKFFIVYCLWQAIYAEADSTLIANRSISQMLLYYMLVILLGNITRSGDRSGLIAVEIYQGDLSKYLLYPRDYFSFKYAQHLGGMFPTLLQLIVFASIYCVCFDLPPSISITPTTISMTIVCLVLANFFDFVVSFCIELIAFWAENIWSLLLIRRGVLLFLGGSLFPLDGYPEWAQDILYYLPFQYIYYIPVETLLGNIEPKRWLIGLAIVLGWSLLGYWIAKAMWRRGNKTYTGVGI